VYKLPEKPSPPWRDDDKVCVRAFVRQAVGWCSGSPYNSCSGSSSSSRALAVRWAFAAAAAAEEEEAVHATTPARLTRASVPAPVRARTHTKQEGHYTYELGENISSRCECMLRRWREWLGRGS
jgi:hypothetical protein